MITVQRIENKERGVTASLNIKKGTTIEVAPVSVVPANQIAKISKTTIFRYYFVRPIEYHSARTTETNTIKQVNGYLVFGLASLCNHKNEPNAHVNWVEDAIGWWSHLIAKKDINAGEEITLFYTNIEEYPDANQFSH